MQPRLDLKACWNQFTYDDKFLLFDFYKHCGYDLGGLGTKTTW